MKLIFFIISVVIGSFIGPFVYFYIYPGILKKNKYLEFQWKKPNNIGDATKMIRKLKEMFPIAGIIWQLEDVIQYAANHDPEFSVTEQEAEEVIGIMEHHKDCNNGITWDHLADALEQVHGPFEDDEPGLCSWCNGSGEGMHDGTTCTNCKGSGEERRIE